MGKIFGLVLSSLLLFVLLASPASAKVIVQEKGNLSIAKGQIVNDDLFLGSETVEILGTVNGDVYVGAGVANINGIINGDLVMGSGNVTLSGIVRDDIYMGGGNVVIQNAKIGGSLIVGAGTLQIDNLSTIGGSLISGAGTLSNKASIARNAMIGAGTVNLDSKILGELRVAAGDIVLGTNTNIGGDVNYILDEENENLVVPSGAVIAGTVKKMEGAGEFNNTVNKSKEDFGKLSNTFNKSFRVISFLGALIIGFILIKVRGNKVSQFADGIFKNFAKNALVGFLILILTIPLAVVLMITLIGIPLSFIMLTLYGLGIYFAKIVVGLSLGLVIVKTIGWQKVNVYLVFTIGLLALYLLRSIPVLGFFVGLVSSSLGLGAIFTHFKPLKV